MAHLAMERPCGVGSCYNVDSLGGLWADVRIKLVGSDKEYGPTAGGAEDKHFAAPRFNTNAAARVIQSRVRAIRASYGPAYAHIVEIARRFQQECLYSQRRGLNLWKLIPIFLPMSLPMLKSIASR